jgi:glycosyltransferase involved in cell wall biosynthesis
MIFFSMFYKHKEGGFNKRLYRLYRAIAERGHKVHYVSCERFPVEHPNISCHTLNLPFKADENAIFWAIFLFVAPIYSLYICWSYKVDRIVVFGSWYSAFCILPRVLLKTGIILFLRADNVERNRLEGKSGLRRMFNYPLEYTGLAVADRIYANIGLVRKNVIDRYEIPEDKVGIIYNNINEIRCLATSARESIRESLGIPLTAFAVVTSGVFYRRKNIGFLIKAFAQVDRNSGARLIIIGDDVSQGTEREELESSTKSLMIADVVLFTGWRDDSVDIIGACDLFVLPTLHEGFPNSLLDAFSVGVPTFGSRIEEITEVLYCDELLFNIDHVSELTEKIEKAARRSEYYEEIRRLSGERAQEFCFDWDERISQIITSGDSS